MAIMKIVKAFPAVCLIMSVQLLASTPPAKNNIISLVACIAGCSLTLAEFPALCALCDAGCYAKFHPKDIRDELPLCVTGCAISDCLINGRKEHTTQGLFEEKHLKTCLQGCDETCKMKLDVAIKISSTKN